IKVIMLTAMAERGTVEKAKKLGADDYILKPFAPADIIARIR
ncbi:MAG: response regulator transcription factor, partial [Lachnospiraceae bacterium]|nr:response regulator transcription factor [Lachnospiraceae bacterium]